MVKYILISFCLFIVSAILLVYTTMVLPPTSNGEIISLNLAVVILENFFLVGSFFSLLSFILSLIITPSVRIHNIVRRSFLFSLVINGLIWMKVNGVLTLAIGILFVLVVIIVETIIYQLGK